MHAIPANVASRQTWLVGTSRPVPVLGSVVWAVIATLIAASTVAFGGPVTPDSGVGMDAPDVRWVMKLGRPYRSLDLKCADADLSGAAAVGSRLPDVSAAGTDADRWWTSDSVPEGVTIASLTPRSLAVNALGRLFSADHWVDARRFFGGDDAAGIRELRRAESAGLGRPSSASAYAMYTAAASDSRDTDSFLGLATPAFGSRLRAPGRPTVGVDSLGARGPAAGINPRISATPTDAVPVGTGENAGRTQPAMHPRTTVASTSGGVFSAILGHGGGLMVWQLSRRRNKRRRAAVGR